MDIIMYLQKAKFSNFNKFWLVLDNNYLPIKPIKEFLLYLRNINNSVNSLHAYAHHLKLYWEYLASIQQDWTQITYSELANFIQWLRLSSHTVIPLQKTVIKRKESTINTILSAVSSFYNFQQKLGEVNITLTTTNSLSACSYRSLLHHIKKTKPARNRFIKVKQPKHAPKILTHKQVQEIKKHCTSLRDKFLISLLYETGLRIGQALGLHHEDITSWDNEIIIRYRNDNENGAYSKSRHDQVVHVSSTLMKLYADYVIGECSDIQSDFVFVALQSRHRGQPYTYHAIQDLFNRLSKKSGVHVTPHMFRHTHATELIKAGWDSSYVQKRLGHSSVQTTIEQYTHLNNADLKDAFKRYQKRKGKTS